VPWPLPSPSSPAGLGRCALVAGPRSTVSLTRCAPLRPSNPKSIGVFVAPAPSNGVGLRRLHPSAQRRSDCRRGRCVGPHPTPPAVRVLHTAAAAEAAAARAQQPVQGCARRAGSRHHAPGLGAARPRHEPGPRSSLGRRSGAGDARRRRLLLPAPRPGSPLEEEEVGFSPTGGVDGVAFARANPALYGGPRSAARVAASPMRATSSALGGAIASARGSAGSSSVSLMQPNPVRVDRRPRDADPSSAQGLRVGVLYFNRSR